MTRHLRKGLLAFFLVLVLACAAVTAVLFAQNGSVKDGATSGGIKATDFSLEDAPVATFNLGRGGADDETNKIYNYPNFANGWTEAVKSANDAYKADSKSYVKVVLHGNWTPSTGSTSFGTSRDEEGYVASFSEGRILVPSGTNIALELSGY